MVRKRVAWRGMEIESLLSTKYGVVACGLTLSYFVFKTMTNGRKRGGAILSALIWLIIISLIFVMYTFKNEVTVITDRVISNLFVSRPSIDKDGRMIHIYKNDRDRHFHIDTMINNKQVTFLVDTGASDITLSRTDARSIGVLLEALKYDKQYSTANGIINAAIINIDKMKIGDITFTNVKASIGENDTNSTSLLGTSFLDRFKYYIFKDDVLTLKY